LLSNQCDQARSPKRATSPEVPAAAAAAASSSVASAPEGTQRSGVHVDVLLERMAIAYDPVTRRLVRPKSPPPASKTSAHADDVDDADDADASPLKGSPVKSRYSATATTALGRPINRSKGNTTLERSTA